jgi:hypothetical protein
MEENTSNKQPKQKAVIENKPMTGMTIVGVNLIVLVIYTALLKLSPDNGSLILDAFCLLLHVVFCLIMAMVKKSWTWVLAASLVLAIGFSTCVYFLPLRIN